MAKPSKQDDVRAWARSVRRAPGKCSVCRLQDLRDDLVALCEEWASGRAPYLSWPKIAAYLRDRHGTSTAWESLRNHVRDHDAETWGALQGRESPE